MPHLYATLLTGEVVELSRQVGEEALPSDLLDFDRFGLLTEDRKWVYVDKATRVNVAAIVKIELAKTPRLFAPVGLGFEE